MNDQERQIIYSILIRLIDGGEVLNPMERRDLLNELCRLNCEMSLSEFLTATENQRNIQIKRGPSDKNNEYMGLPGEITMDTDTNTIRVHDGETIGGTAVARQNEIPNITNLIHCMMLDYKNAETVQDFPYTAKSFGWLFGHIYALKSAASIYVNDTEVVSVGSWSESGQNFPWAFPLSPQDTVTKTNNTVDFVKFIPLCIQ